MSNNKEQITFSGTNAVSVVSFMVPGKIFYPMSGPVSLVAGRIAEAVTRKAQSVDEIVSEFANMNEIAIYQIQFGLYADDSIRIRFCNLDNARTYSD